MDPKEARAVLREARQLASEGLLPADSLARIEARYIAAAAKAGNASGGAVLAIYAIAGVLLAAAAVALVQLLDVPDDVAPFVLLGLAVMLGGGALAAHELKRSADLVDAAAVAAMVTLAVGAFLALAEHDNWLGHAVGLVATAVLAALVFMRGDRPLVPAVGVITTYGTSAGTAFGWLARGHELGPWRGDELATLAWSLFGLLFGAAVLVASRRLGRAWRMPILALCTVGVGTGLLLLVLEVFEPHFVSGDEELAFGLLMVGILAVGVTLREKGIVVASAVAIAIDAIVFAFDVGSALFGVVTLVAVAALLLWRGPALRRYLRE